MIELSTEDDAVYMWVAPKRKKDQRSILCDLSLSLLACTYFHCAKTVDRDITQHSPVHTSHWKRMPCSILLGCVHVCLYNTIQYNTIQYNTIQYNTIQYNTIQYNTIQYNTIQYNTIQYNTIQYNTIQYSFISAQHICSVHVMSVIVVDIYINAGLGDSY